MPTGRPTHPQWEVGALYRSVLGSAAPVAHGNDDYLTWHPSPIFSPTPVTVYRLAGGHDLVLAAEVTGRDLLRLLVVEKITHPNARAATRNGLNDTTRKLSR